MGHFGCKAVITSYSIHYTKLYDILLGGHSAVLDHVSGAWGDDETFDLSNLKNASIQWCGIEESAGRGVEWEVMIDADADGIPDSWERKVRDYDPNDSITDFITQILPDGDLDGDVV